jgi:hypothetical protein
VKIKVFGVMMTLVLVLVLCLAMAVPVSAAATHLVATGTAGTEARIIVGLPAGTTLSNITSISWQEYLVQGYPPHVDIILDLDNDGIGDDALVVEYAYNTATHYAEAHTATEAYGAQTGAWYNTFNDDGNGPSSVTDTTFAWLNSGAPGPYPPDGINMIGDTLANWKAGTVSGGGSVDGSTKVLRLEIEIDNWIRDTDAYVDSIEVNGAPASGVNLEATVPDIVAISVTPTSIDFGTLLPGQTSAVHSITVSNVGTHQVDVDAAVTGATLFTSYLELKNVPDNTSWVTGPWNDIITDMDMSNSEELRTRLPVPSGYVPTGTETGVLTFTAKASP